ncbi:MAG TPA: TolC family protein [Holophagaceae bacterium]
MRRIVRSMLALATFATAQAAGLPATVQSPPSESRPATSDDPVLAGLLHDTLARNPEAQRASAQVHMDREKVPQAKALPDPTLSFGLQNDGFNRIQVGRMETSFYSVGFTQPFYWPGKRGLRGDVAALGARITDTARNRTLLGLEADVRRGYAALLLVRGQLDLLKEQAEYLDQAERLARTRYEVGQGSQADLLRAQLEKIRLEQTRLSLEAAERSVLADLNRLRQQDPGDPIPTPKPLKDLPLPDLLTADQVEARSPELAAARLGVQQTQRQVELARLDRRPDFAFSAGIMPRGSLDPMWQVGFSFTLPIYGRSKQQRALAEHEHHLHVQNADVGAVKTLLRQRTEERLAQVDALQRELGLYQQGLLVQSQSSFQATLAQYSGGKGSFLAVLESLDGWVSDRQGELQTRAQLQAQLIALHEAALAPTTPLPGGAMGSATLAVTSLPTLRGAAPAGAGQGSPAAMKM